MLELNQTGLVLPTSPLNAYITTVTANTSVAMTNSSTALIAVSSTVLAPAQRFFSSHLSFLPFRSLGF